MEIRSIFSRLVTIVFLTITVSTQLFAQDDASLSKADSVTKKLVNQAQSLKKDIVKLNSELYQFEEDLLYPTDTQIAVFLSLAGSSFGLDSIELQLDGKLITSHLYKDKEIQALKKGGIQKLYVGSLSDGNHKLTANFNGQGSNQKYYRQKKALTFKKTRSAKYIELIVGDSPTSREPLFKVKQW